MSERGDEFCCEWLFQRWLEGMGVQPATWSALLGALDDARFFNLVEDARFFDLVEDATQPSLNVCPM